MDVKFGALITPTLQIHYSLDLQKCTVEKYAQFKEEHHHCHDQLLAVPCEYQP